MRSDYGQRLFLAREHAKLTQPELCKLVGMSQSNYSKLERSGNGSSYTTALAEACGVSALWLANNKGNMLDKHHEIKAAPGHYHLATDGMSSHAIALGKLFDKVPTDDPVLWATTYQQAGQIILDAIQSNKPNQTLAAGQESTDAPRQSVQGTEQK